MDADADAGASRTALHILRIVELKMAFAVDGKFMTECCFCSHVLEEQPTETGDHTYTLPTYNTQTMKFFAIYAKNFCTVWRVDATFA
jgi:hypothetical protein